MGLHSRLPSQETTDMGGAILGETCDTKGTSRNRSGVDAPVGDLSAGTVPILHQLRQGRFPARPSHAAYLDVVENVLDQREKMKVLLFLSGGKDSRRSLEILVAQGHTVRGLCFSGWQQQEVIGAMRAAKDFNIDLTVYNLPWLNEKTWNPLILFIRNLIFMAVGLWLVRKLHYDAAAAGVKAVDFNHWQLKPIETITMPLIQWLSKITKIKVLYPVWELK